MTYVAAFRDAGAVYLFADSAVTREGPLAANEAKLSSFGERHIETASMSVAESALKVFNFDRAVLTAAGSAAAAFQLAETLQDQLANGVAPRSALAIATATHGPFLGDRFVQLLLAIPEEPTPALVAFNAQKLEEITEIPVNVGAHFGRLGVFEESVWRRFHDVFRKRFAERPDRVLACTLGVVQGAVVRSTVLEKHRAGGTFTGVYVTSQGIHWQADTLYLVLQPALHGLHLHGHVSVLARGEGVVVDSSLSQSLRLFGNAVTIDDPDEWLALWDTEVRRTILERAYDFVVCLDARDARTTVVEMGGRTVSKYLRLEPKPGNSSGDFGLHVSPLAMAKLTAPFGDPPHPAALPAAFNWLPFDQ